MTRFSGNTFTCKVLNCCSTFTLRSEWSEESVWTEPDAEKQLQVEKWQEVSRCCSRFWSSFFLRVFLWSSRRFFSVCVCVRVVSQVCFIQQDQICLLQCFCVDSLKAVRSRETGSAQTPAGSDPVSLFSSLLSQTSRLPLLSFPDVLRAAKHFFCFRNWFSIEYQNVSSSFYLVSLTFTCPALRLTSFSFTRLTN